MGMSIVSWSNSHHLQAGTWELKKTDTGVEVIVHVGIDQKPILLF
jgi:phosphotransferase system IIA component